MGRDRFLPLTRNSAHCLFRWGEGERERKRDGRDGLFGRKTFYCGGDFNEFGKRRCRGEEISAARSTGDRRNKV